MQVLLTIAVLGGVAAWLSVVMRRLTEMRARVQAAWKLLEADQTNAAAKAIYNNHVAAYNAALEGFPAN
ncbi:MAG TPA: hypothetical protein VF491_20065, partial [Vicinamibacterales bacterium]